MAADGTPIVYGDKSYPLAPGKRTADIVMFGRAFREKAKDGPYTVQDILRHPPIHQYRRAELRLRRETGQAEPRTRSANGSGLPSRLTLLRNRG